MIKAAGLTMMLASGALLAACSQSSSGPEETVQQLMANKVQPTAKTYWDAVQYISDETGDHDIRPQTDAEWEKVRQASVNLQQYGQLMLTPEYSEGRAEDWKRFSQGLVDISRKAEQAAIDKDPEAVFEVGGTVYSVCSACHMAYPPEEGLEPGSET